MRIVGSVVARAPPDEVWTWWTDYGEPGTSATLDHGLVKTTREVLAHVRDRFVLRDYWPGNVSSVDHEVTVRTEGRRLEERSLRGTPFAYSSQWRFESEDEGRATRITRIVDADVPVPGFLQELGVPLTRRAIEKDISAHLEEFEADRGGK